MATEVSGLTQESVTEALDRIFSHDSELYRGRGFLERRIGFGRRPALIVIDLANAWTRPVSPFTCDGVETLIARVNDLIGLARTRDLPIIFTTMAYSVTEGPHADAGLYRHKLPMEVFKLGSEAVAIDDRLDQQPTDQLIVKKRASAFHGTYLAGFLRSIDVDTLIITGVTASGCVRNTTEDAINEGFRPIVVRECVGDRIPGAVQWNLFDIDAKFGDVEAHETVLEYLEKLPAGGAEHATVGSAQSAST
jgi:nicotinamidase-related amidase